MHTALVLVLCMLAQVLWLHVAFAHLCAEMDSAALTIHFLHHAVHALKETVVQEPDVGIVVILLKGHCMVWCTHGEHAFSDGSLCLSSFALEVSCVHVLFVTWISTLPVALSLSLSAGSQSWPNNEVLTGKAVGHVHHALVHIPQQHAHDTLLRVTRNPIVVVHHTE